VLIVQDGPLGLPFWVFLITHIQTHSGIPLHEGKVKIYKTVILPVVLYGCENFWSLTHRLRVFENRVLSRIFVPKWDEVTGEWRKLHSEELHSLYSSPDNIRQVK
jgi:hypothetical protein